jgi:hypothetical protein
MKHRRESAAEMRGEPLRLVRNAREGVRWERGDGLAIRMAAPERGPVVERGRISALGMLLAWAVSSPPPR